MGILDRVSTILRANINAGLRHTRLDRVQAVLLVLRADLVGIGAAEVVYEVPVEGQVTRFLALFHSQDADLAAVRKAYSVLVRRYHPDRNGGDRTHEAKLRNVIDAWQTLKVANAFT